MAAEEFKEEDDLEYSPVAFNKQISWQREVSKDMNFPHELD